MLTASITLQVLADLRKVEDLAAAAAPINYTKRTDFTDGVGAGQANQVWADKRSIAASGTDTVDLSGVLTNIYGASITLTKVKALIIKAAPGNVNDVVVGGAAANPFATPFGDPTDKVKVRPGGMLALVAADAAGYAVTAGTADQLLVANSGAGTGVDYDIIIIGAQ